MTSDLLRRRELEQALKFDGDVERRRKAEADLAKLIPLSTDPDGIVTVGQAAIDVVKSAMRSKS